VARAGGIRQVAPRTRGCLTAAAGWLMRNSPLGHIGAGYFPDTICNVSLTLCLDRDWIERFFSACRFTAGRWVACWWWGVLGNV
jgi:hypothetical protein